METDAPFGGEWGVLALGAEVGREGGAREGVGLAEDRSSGLLEIVDAHEQLFSGEEKGVDLDLLIRAH